jgi:tetratricopeptide (TPR) repeat protein
MSLIRASLLFAAVALVAAPPYQAQTPGKGPANQDLLISQVRTALGRGRAADARSAVDTATAPPIAKEFATALIEIFEGKDDAARTRLQPLADRGNNPDATLELALIHMRTGRRADAERMLAPLVAVRTFNGPDDYFRLARAALPVGEYLLAKDAYMEIESAKRADIQTGFGDLFLAKHAYGEAVTSYKLGRRSRLDRGASRNVARRVLRRSEGRGGNARNGAQAGAGTSRRLGAHGGTGAVRGRHRRGEGGARQGGAVPAGHRR